MDDIRRITRGLRHLEMPANGNPQAAGRATGGVFYQAEASRSPAKVSFREDNRYSGGKLMVWQPEKKGEN